MNDSKYRRYAKECLEMASVTEDPQVRAYLLCSVLWVSIISEALP